MRQLQIEFPDTFMMMQLEIEFSVPVYVDDTWTEKKETQS